MKKLLIFFLSLNLAFFSPFASADFDIAKYQKNSNVKSGSKSAFGYSVMNAADGKPYLWSGLKRQATPSTLSKLYKFGGATVAFSAAVYGILGAVDWVMDPDNNRIKYTSAEPQDLPNYTLQAYFVSCDSTGSNQYQTHKTAAAALSSPDFQQCMALNYAGRDANHPSCHVDNYTVTETAQASNPPVPSKTFVYATASGKRINCPRTDDLLNIKIRAIPDLSTGELEERYLDFEVIAEEVIEAADALDADAQEDTNNANDPETWVRTGVADPNGDPEPELKVNEKPFECHVRDETSKDSCFKIGGLPEEGENINKPDDEGDPEPAGKVELPAFCTWAKPACNFFVNSLSQSRAFFSTATDYFDTVKTYLAEEDPELTEPEEPDIQLPIELQSYEVNFSSNCPAPRTFNVNGGSSFTFDMTLTCEVLSKIRYAFIGLSSFVAFRILSGKDS